jgi:hypothetical protein
VAVRLVAAHRGVEIATDATTPLKPSRRVEQHLEPAPHVSAIVGVGDSEDAGADAFITQARPADGPAFRERDGPASRE